MLQALAHRWIKHRKALAETPLDENVVKNLKKHAEQNHFQRAVRHKMAKQLTTDEIHRLRNMFQELDVDGTGTISVAAMSKVRRSIAMQYIIVDLRCCAEHDSNCWCRPDSFGGLSL